MTRYTLHIPEQYNDGSLIPPEDLREYEREIEEIAGGFTLTHGIGGWRGDEQTYREPVRLYSADVGHDLNSAIRRSFQALAQKIATDLSQEAIYLTRQEIETFMVAPVAAS